MIQLYAAVAVAAIVFGGGWQARSWYQDSIDLGKIEVVEKFRAEQSQVAQLVENKLQGLRANERITEKVRIQVVDRPIYNVDCIDADGLRIIESYRAGGSAKPAGKMP